MDKKVYIIIVTWNGMNWIETCLKSIQNSFYPVITIVIDNKSSDETPDYIARHFPEVQLIRNEKNLGFGKANNIGMNLALDAGADYCFLLNQDAYLQPNTVSELIKIAESGDYGIISPVHLNGDASHVDMYFRDFVMANSPDYLDNAMLGHGYTLFESPFIPAAGWLLPRKTMMEIGGFDALFYHYGEDDNYCQRCRYHQRKIIFTTKAFIRHDREETVGNKKMYNHKITYRHLIQDSANILYSRGFLIQKLGRQFYDEIGLFFMYLFSGKWNMIHNFLGDYIKLLCQLSAINKSRQRNKSLHSI